VAGAVSGVRDGGDRRVGVRGNGAERQSPAPCVPTLRQRATPPPPAARLPSTPAAYGGNPRPVQRSPREPCAHARSPARAGRPGTPKACHLSRGESCNRSRPCSRVLRAACSVLPTRRHDTARVHKKEQKGNGKAKKGKGIFLPRCDQVGHPEEA
jgi:hypothetical protein